MLIARVSRNRRKKRCKKTRREAFDIWKRNFFVSNELSLGWNYTTRKLCITCLLSLPPRTRQDWWIAKREFISRLDPPYPYTVFFVSISHSVSRFIFMKYTVNVCCLFAQLIYTIIRRFILSTQARTSRKNYQYVCVRTVRVQGV